MNRKTIRFNQDAFVSCDALPGNIHSALANDISNPGVHTAALHLTSYTAGDTSGKPDNGLPEVFEANLPKRISRKHIPTQAHINKTQNAVFPQSGNEVDFSWRPEGFQNGTFITAKDATLAQTGATQEKSESKREITGLLQQLSNSNLSPNHLPSSYNTYDLQSENTLNINSSLRARHNPNNRNASGGNTTHTLDDAQSSSVMDTDSGIYEQIRTVLGEEGRDWKQVIKTAKSTAYNLTSKKDTMSGTTLASQENRIEQVIQKILNEEENNRVALEHVLTHKFSSELINMQQAMNKKIQDLRETLNNFLMR